MGQFPDSGDVSVRILTGILIRILIKRLVKNFGNDFSREITDFRIPNYAILNDSEQFQMITKTKSFLFRLGHLEASCMILQDVFAKISGKIWQD